MFEINTQRRLEVLLVTVKFKYVDLQCACVYQLACTYQGLNG